MNISHAQFRFVFSQRSVLSAWRLILLSVVLGSWCAAPSTYADSTSTNYAIADSYFPGAASGSLTSTNYAVAEGNVDFFSKNSATSTNYSAEGSIGIRGAPLIPTIQSVSPSAGRFFSDSNADFTVTALSPDGDTLAYLAKQDGTTKDGPQASSNLVWALSGSDLGRRAIAIHVSDPDGNTIQNQSAYVYRRPVK